jgi:hypothetical protein
MQGLNSMAQPLKLDFGSTELSARQRALLIEMNAQLPALCRAMPKPLRDPALLAIQRSFSGFRLQNLLHFFEKFYAPAWTVLDLLDPERAALSEDDVRLGARTQAMALFVQMLDAHLSDGRLPANHLFLQLRTEAWRWFSAGVEAAAVHVEGGDALGASLIDTYFEGVHRQDESYDATSYRARTCQKNAMGLVIPLLLARRAAVDERVLRSAYEAFVVAWRMLEDLRDFERDAKTGNQTSLYFVLPQSLQALWKSADGKELADRLRSSGQEALFVDLIGYELDAAVTLAREAGLAGYAAQIHHLRAGLRSAQ